MRFTFICIAVFILASMLFMGEAAWLILVCVVSVRAVFRLRRLGLRCVVLAFGLAVLTAHFVGYKFYGSATIHDNRPVLEAPHVFASLAAPNIVLTSDGSRFELRGVTFTPELLSLPPENLHRLLSHSSEPVLVQPDPTSPSGIAFQRRREYWCGNTFFPTLMPRRLPAYSRTDFGSYLTRCRLATAQRSE